MTPRRIVRRRRFIAAASALDNGSVLDLVQALDGKLPTLHGVPTFTALQGICAKYLLEHQFVMTVDARSFCTCRLEVGTYDQWLEHVSELQASHISAAVQEARRRD